MCASIRNLFVSQRCLRAHRDAVVRLASPIDPSRGTDGHGHGQQALHSCPLSHAAPLLLPLPNQFQTMPPSTRNTQYHLTPEQRRQANLRLVDRQPPSRPAPAVLRSDAQPPASPNTPGQSSNKASTKRTSNSLPSQADHGYMPTAHCAVMSLARAGEWTAGGGGSGVGLLSRRRAGIYGLA